MLSGQEVSKPRMILVEEILADQLVINSSEIIDSRDYGIPDLSAYHSIELDLGVKTTKNSTNIFLFILFDNSTNFDYQYERIFASGTTRNSNTSTGNFIGLVAGANNLPGVYSRNIIKLFKAQNKVYMQSISHVQLSATEDTIYIITGQTTVDLEFKFFRLYTESGIFFDPYSTIKIIGHRKVPFSSLHL